MVYNWTGATNVVTNPVYGKYLDTQHLYTIERFAGIGTGFYAEQIQDNYVLRSLPFLWSEGLSREKGYEAIMGEFAVRFAAQGALKGILGNPTYDFSADKLVFSSTLSQILSNAVANVPADTVDKNVYWSEIARTLTLYASDFGSTQAAIKTQVDTAAGYAVQINNLGGRYFEGDSGNNTVTGNTLTNYLIGLSGADTLIGGLGDDYLEGGTGADTYRYASGDGNDYIYELTSGADGTSIDKLHFTNSNRSALTFTRVDSNNLVPASGIGANSLRIDVAGGGSVVIRDHFLFDNNAATNAYYRIEQIQFADSTFMDFAASKAATLLSTSGNDTLTGFSDSETITGGAGNDSIRGFDGTDSLLGGSGNDTLYGGIGNDTLEGNSDDDVIYGDDGNDSIIGSTGVDTLFGGAGADSIKGDSGNDSLNGGTENDDIKGGDGDDSVDGGYGNDTIEGGLGFDTILGYDGDDLLDGNSSNDLIYGEKGLDTLYGSEGNDTLYGGNENDSLLGGTGTDNLYGEIGNDYLYGDDGGDNMYGGSGSDTLDGSEGKDNLYGGTGADIFFYNALTDSLNTNPDRIKDFEDGVDVIRLQGLGFTGIAAGAATGTVLGYTQTSTLTTISDAGTFQFIIENGTITLTNADFMFV
jgi:Ca2+-binding RTX toxin-like protein